VACEQRAASTGDTEGEGTISMVSLVGHGEEYIYIKYIEGVIYIYIYENIGVGL
jgi:hypothetical protein